MGQSTAFPQRSLAGRDPGVTPRRMVTWAHTRKWASFTDEHAATASVRNSTQGGLLTWDLIRPGSPAIWWRFFRCFSTVESDIVERQVRQIVQS